MSNKRRQSILAQLLKLAKSEDDVKHIDFEFLLMLAKELGVEQEDLKLLFEDYLALFPPRQPQESLTQLQRLIVILRNENELSSSDRAYILTIGLKLGINAEAVERIISLIIQRNGYVPKEELIQLVNTYNN
jgi:hypothetical protein